MPTSLTPLLLTLLFFTTQAQEFPDTLILATGETIQCQVGMINTQNVFIKAQEFNKKGKAKTVDQIIPIPKVKDLRLNSEPNIANKYYTELLNKFDGHFFEEGCDVISHRYDYVKKERISETHQAISEVVGMPNAWIGVTMINDQRFLTITKLDYGQGFIHVLEGAQVVLNLVNDSQLVFTANQHYSSINDTRLVTGNSTFFAKNVIEENTDSMLKLLLPVTMGELTQLSQTQITSVIIETAISEIVIEVDAQKLDESARGCLCGSYMR